MFPDFYSSRGNSQRVSAKNGVVAAGHPLVAQAGVEILKEGGNAIDAAVTAGLVACVVEPSRTSLGGGGDAVMYFARTRESDAVDFWGRTPRRMSRDFYEIESDKEIGDAYLSWAKVRNDANIVGHTSVVVPGAVAGLSELIEKYGTIDFGAALQPAIKLAENGVIVDLQFSDEIAHSMNVLSRDPGLVKLFTDDGKPIISWEFNPYYPKLVVQKALACTLGKLAKHGPDIFYKGELAAIIARDMEKNGGLIDEQELSGYRPHWEGTIPGVYRGCEVLYLPGSGGTVNMEALNVLEGYELNKYSPVHFSTLHLLIKSILLAFSDMLQKLGGEPGRESLRKLASKKYADGLRGKLGSADESSSKKKNYHAQGKESTTNLTVIDRERNAVSLTLSLGQQFGAGVQVPQTGIHLNDGMRWSDPVPGRSMSIKPGKRQFLPPSSTIVLKKGRPLLATGAHGGTRIMPAVLRVINGVVDYNLDVLDAQELPRVCQAGRDVGPTFVDSRIPAKSIDVLRKMGDNVVSVDRQFGFGFTTGIYVDNKGGRVHGAVERAPIDTSAATYGY